MLPSFGSMSMPADVPHLRPAGSSPQLRVTFGAGFGSPSPVIGLAVFAAACAASDAPASELTSAVSSSTAQAPIVGTRGVMTSPRKVTRDYRSTGGLFCARSGCDWDQPHLLQRRAGDIQGEPGGRRA